MLPMPVPSLMMSQLLDLDLALLLLWCGSSLKFYGLEDLKKDMVLENDLEGVLGDEVVTLE